jgi:predicted phage replisome organizer
MANDVKWIKLTTDMFDNRKIKHLRRLPDGNNIVLIWVMLLTMAGRCNSGGMIFLTENIPYTPKMLADELGFEENTVILALQVLEQFQMVVTDNGHFKIAGWEEYQNVEGMDRIREQTRKRVAKCRQNKLLSDGNVTCNVTVTECNATEEDKEIRNKNKDIKNKDNKKKSSSVDFDSILSDISDDSLKELYLDYISMRKSIKSPITSERALKMLINKVNTLEPDSIERQKKLLENAIVSNWKSVYPLKDEPAKQSSDASYDMKAWQQSNIRGDDFMAKLNAMYEKDG